MTDISKIDHALLEWQRMLDPSKFNKKTGAQFHTAPSVVFPDSADYPEDAIDGSVTILFHISNECWLSDPQKLSLESPIIVEKPPAKRAKNGPVLVLDAATAYIAIPVKENYYWAAWTLTTHETKSISFRPGKPKPDGSLGKTVVVATFLPNDGEPIPQPTKKKKTTKKKIASSKTTSKKATASAKKSNVETTSKSKTKSKTESSTAKSTTAKSSKATKTSNKTKTK